MSHVTIETFLIHVTEHHNEVVNTSFHTEGPEFEFVSGG